jgi:hypothetical protein
MARIWAPRRKGDLATELLRESGDADLAAVVAAWPTLPEAIKAGILADLASKADHYAAMKRKYGRAARYPWLTVDPDPPLLK